jgi:hypothetical protein
MIYWYRVVIRITIEGVEMSREKSAWSICIEELLTKHNLKPQTAVEFVKKDVGYTTIYGWINYNGEPTYEMAEKFLQHFPYEDRIKCMDAAGFSIPPHWIKTPIQAVHVALRGVNSTLSDEAKREVEEFVKNLIERDRKQAEQSKLPKAENEKMED